MNGFLSLTEALADWFDSQLCDLPEALRQRVERELSPMPWDTLSADQRRSIAHQLDYQHDPATAPDRKYWWNFFARKRAIEEQLAQWEAVNALTANDLATKESRLAELRQELTRMDQHQRQKRGDGVFSQKRRDIAEDESSIAQNPPARYIAYPKAMKLLVDRLDATPDELAMWIFMGPSEGGIAAYLNANELVPPPRFFYGMCSESDFDYLSPLMACWFDEGDIAHFKPADRYITGAALIGRWSRIPRIQPEAFIMAKIAESRLMDAHPICGLTQGTMPGDDAFPPLCSGLFQLSQVESIEAEDFGDSDTQSESRISPCMAAAADQIRWRFLVKSDADANDKWWKAVMRNAARNGLAECRVGSGKQGPGGSLWRPDLIAGWLVDRHSKRREGLSAKSARAALTAFPGCAEIANDLFPPDE